MFPLANVTRKEGLEQSSISTLMKGTRMPEAGMDLTGDGFVSTLMDLEVGRAHMFSAN